MKIILPAEGLTFEAVEKHLQAKLPDYQYIYSKEYTDKRLIVQQTRRIEIVIKVTSNCIEIDNGLPIHLPWLASLFYPAQKIEHLCNTILGELFTINPNLSINTSQLNVTNRP